MVQRCMMKTIFNTSVLIIGTGWCSATSAGSVQNKSLEWDAMPSDEF